MSDKRSASNPSIEEAIGELEQILATLESSTTSLEESLRRYERGVSLLKHCYDSLAQVELRIMKLAGTDEGVAKLEPFAHSASSEAIKELPDSKSTARSRRKPQEPGSDLPF